MSRIESREIFCKCCGNEMDSSRCVRGTVCGKCKSEGHKFFNCEKCRQSFEEDMRREENPQIVVIGIDDAGRKRILELFHSNFLGVLPSTGLIVDCREHPEALPVQKNGLPTILEPSLEHVKKFKEVLDEAFGGKKRKREHRRQNERDRALRPQVYPKTKLIKDGRYKWKIKK